MTPARMNPDKPPASEPAASAQQPQLSRLRGCLTALIPLALVAFVVVAIPYVFLATLFWAADGDWKFEGRGFRYWLLVKGSRLERLGFVAPTPVSAKYSIGFQEGNFPGWSIVQYESSAQPFAIAEDYAQRCTAMKLKVIEPPKAESTEAGGNAASLTCEIEKYLDVEVYAERKDGIAQTEVNLRVWGSD
jgi:hypothetical protein